MRKRSTSGELVSKVSDVLWVKQDGGGGVTEDMLRGAVVSFWCLMMGGGGTCQAGICVVWYPWEGQLLGQVMGAWMLVSRSWDGGRGGWAGGV